MRLPLELLRLVLVNVVEDYARPYQESHIRWFFPATFLNFRLVNRLFDQEIQSYLFRYPLYGQLRLINGNSWVTAPTSLREKYLCFKIEKHANQPNLFATLFIPLFERMCAGLHIAQSDHLSRQYILARLLPIPMHDQELSWVVAHKAWKYDHAKNRVLTFPFDDANESQSYSFDEWQRLQIEEDWLFMQTCLAIIKNDHDAIVQMMQDKYIPVNRVSLCFGTSLAKFALRHGNIETLKLVLRLGTHFARNHPYDQFRFALTVDGEDSLKMYALFDHYFFVMDIVDPGKLMDDIIWFAIWKHHLTILDCALHWLDANWNLAQKWYILDRAFVNAIYAGDLTLVERLYPEMEKGQRYDSKTVLQLAAQSQNPDLQLLRFFLKHGAEVNPEPRMPSRTNYHASFPIKAHFTAAKRGLSDWVDVLLEAGADPRNGPEEESLMSHARMGNILRDVSDSLEKYGWYRSGWYVSKGKGKSKEL